MDQDKDVEAQRSAPEVTDTSAFDSEKRPRPETPAHEVLERVTEEAQEAATEQIEGVGEMATEVRADVTETQAKLVRATQEYIAATEEKSMVSEYRGFSFGDGFRFGCGFAIAGCLVWLVLSILVVVIPVVLSALNVIKLPGS